MKIRKGYVSNSSSASFVIKKKHLTEEQLEAIRDHYNYAVTRFYDLDTAWCNEGDSWHLKEDEKKIYGETSMNNFDMREFLQAIGVPLEHIGYDGD